MPLRDIDVVLGDISQADCPSDLAGVHSCVVFAALSDHNPRVLNPEAISWPRISS